MEAQLLPGSHWSLSAVGAAGAATGDGAEPSDGRHSLISKMCFLKALWFHRRRFLTQAELFGWSLFCSSFSALLSAFSLARTLRLLYFLVLFHINCPPKNQDGADVVLEVDLKLVSDYWSERDDVQMSSLLRTEMKPMRTRVQWLTVDILEYKPKNTTASHSRTLPIIVSCFWSWIFAVLILRADENSCNRNLMVQTSHLTSSLWHQHHDEELF